MSIAAQRTKLLIVDTSPSMAQVLKTFAEQYGYDADVFSDSSMACVALSKRFTAGIAQSYDCVLLGWPEGKIGIITDLLGKLGTPVHADLPMIVFSQKVNSDAMTLARRRGNTRTLLWKDHKEAAEIIEGMVVHEVPAVAPTPAVASTPVVAASKQAVAENRKVLLVDNASAETESLRDTLERNGYSVFLSNSAAEARSVLERNRFDLVVTEFFLRGESGELFCGYMRSMSPEKRPVYAVMTNKNMDSVVQRSLSVGAITCLNKSETTEILYARLDAIAKGLTSVNTPVAESAAAVTQSSPIMLEKPVAHSPVIKAPVAVKPVAKPEVAKPEVIQPVTAKPIVTPVNYSTTVIAGLETDVTVVKAPTILDKRAMQNVIQQALTSEFSARFSVLMLDIKIVALATGDKLSIGGSEGMLDIVKARFQKLYTRKNSIAYMGDGKFLFLLATNQAEQALTLSRKLCERIPTMVSYLSDTELLSYGAFLEIASVPKNTTARHVLMHCKAACTKAEQSRLDNSIFVINEKTHLRGIATKRARNSHVPAITSSSAKVSGAKESVRKKRKTAVV